MESFDLCVIGLGYVGLPTAALAAKAGLTVLGVDISSRRVADIREGNLDQSEPGLASLVSGTIASGHLKLSTGLERSCDTFIIAVPTPSRNGLYDSRYVDAAAQLLTPALRGDELVILESTCPPGSTIKLKETIVHLGNFGTSNGLAVAHCPERVLPGNVIEEISGNDRVIGGVDSQSTKRAVDFYSKISTGELWGTDSTTAEMSKLVENSYRDVNIAFANEISQIAYEYGVNANDLIQLANRHPRVNVLSPSIGVGGHCICVDPYFLIQASPHQSALLSAARRVNDGKTVWVAEQLIERLREAAPRSVGWFGLAYKPNASDSRNSPSVRLLRILAEEFPSIQFLVHDPFVPDLPRDLTCLSNVSTKSIQKVKKQCEFGILAVEHKQYLSLDVQDCSVPEIKLVRLGDD